MANPDVKIKIVIVLIALVVLIGGSVIVLDYYVLRLDTKGMDCEKLPTAADVENIVARHRDTLNQIEQNSISVWIDTDRCPGRADIVIDYGTIDQRNAIRSLIGDTFFGVPYRMFNV